MNAVDYLETVRRNLAADGCEVGNARVGPLQAMVGYRGDFLPQMMAKLHLFTVVAGTSEVNGNAVDDFTRRVGEYGKTQKGALRGLQSGVAAFAVLVSDRVTPDGVARAQQPPKIQFAVRVQPVVVDMTAGAVHTFRRRQIWGVLMNGHLRRKLDLYVPEPLSTGPYRGGAEPGLG